MTAAPTVSNIVDQFRYALEACEHAHVNSLESTPYAASRAGQVSFSDPLSVPIEMPAVPLPTERTFISMPHLPNLVPASSPSSAPVTTQTVDPSALSASAVLPLAAARPTCKPSTTCRLIVYIVLAGIIAAVAMYVRKRYLSTIWNVIAGSTPAAVSGLESEDEPVNRIVAQQQLKKRLRTKVRERTEVSPDNGGLSEMTALLRNPNTVIPAPLGNAPDQTVEKPQRAGGAQEAPACVRTESNRVDLRRVRFDQEDSATASEEPAGGAFFEVEEDDPNFVPL
uniref:Transmembrane protein n=1 Tax=viral metagenome TaxID=1070528 RepID=A0A6C0C1V8_9ZZZZ